MSNKRIKDAKAISNIAETLLKFAENFREFNPHHPIKEIKVDIPTWQYLKHLSFDKFQTGFSSALYNNRVHEDEIRIAGIKFTPIDEFEYKELT